MALEPLKISAMTPVVTLTGAEHIPVVQAGLNKYTTPDQIKGYYAYYYESVNTYADLPDATLHASEIYIVLTSTGVWLVNRKDAGLYYSNGAAWVRLGDIPSYFNSANFQIYDGTNNTKVAKFDLTGITTATTRTYTLPDSDGTLALTNHTHTYLPLTGGTLTGHLLFTDNTYDIGASDATRPRTGYFGTSVRSPLFEGGTAVGSYITYKSTTGAGTATGIAHQFKGGTDGGTILSTFLNNGKHGFGIVAPVSIVDIMAGTNSVSPFGLASGPVLLSPIIGRLEFLTDDLYFTITTGTARKHFIFDDGTVNTSGRLAQYTTNGRLTNAPDISGSGNRVVQASAAGAISATAAIVTGKLVDGTAIALLINNANWTLGLYTGTAISGTYEGMYYRDDSYWYECYADNDWSRIPRA
jgi:hypothetical protein